LARHLKGLQGIPLEALLQKRYEKYRRMGRVLGG
jgi:acetyl-CoA carboxylase alpha subunit